MLGLTEWQDRVLGVVRDRTRHNPLTGAKIAGVIGLPERNSGKEGADIRAIMHALRVKGWPICANGRGYFMARSLEELQSYIDSLNGRIRKEQEAVLGLINAKQFFVKQEIEEKPTENAQDMQIGMI